MRDGDKVGVGGGGGGGGELIRVGFDCEWAVSNAEMLQVLHMILQKLYR